MAQISPEALTQVQIPATSSRVGKDECSYSYDTPKSEHGLFVSLSSFRGFGRDYVEDDHKKTGNILYLNIKHIPKPKEDKEISQPEKKPKHLAIGTPDGFDVEDKVEYDEILNLVSLPSFETFPLPNNDLPMKITMAVDAVMKADSVTKKAEVASWVGDKRMESKISNTLQQLDNGVTIPPSGWKCRNCDLTTNLWLNLTDGAILCGRRNYDGSGGNNHAVEYYQQTQYPLAVKLGTINAEGADVYSYPEDDMVIDTNLKAHLKHFGIDMDAMQKTEKTIAEMELDQNLSFEFNRLQESGKELIPLFGPGYTGLVNLGNSCYMSSILQVLFDFPEFQERYYNTYDDIVKKFNGDPSEDVELQLAKLAFGIHSGKYSAPTSETTQDGIAPKSFKALIGKGHPEFSTMQQQDAFEFLQHFFNILERSNRALNASDPSQVFKFHTEERLLCSQSNMVRYITKIDNILSVPVPLERAVNAEAVAEYEKIFNNSSKDEQQKMEKVRPLIPLMTCLETLASPEHIEGFMSPATGKLGAAEKTFRLKTFPKYLVLQMRKFTIGKNWAPIKLDVLIDAPEEIDLEFLRGHGLQPGEQELPKEAPTAASGTSGSQTPELTPDHTIVSTLLEMGFTENACKRAALKTQNQGVEPAMNWLMEHMDDADLNDPISNNTSSGAANVNIPADPESVAMLVSMGFTEAQALKALNQTQHNLERAADWLFSHSAELDTMEIDNQGVATGGDSGAPAAENVALTDGAPRYRLRAFVSHMGTSTSHGHYVCHIRKDGKWVLFNDNKVATSTDPPKDMAYLYFYEQC